MWLVLFQERSAASSYRDSMYNGGSRFRIQWLTVVITGEQIKADNFMMKNVIYFINLIFISKKNLSFQNENRFLRNILNEIVSRYITKFYYKNALSNVSSDKSEDFMSAVWRDA